MGHFGAGKKGNKILGAGNDVKEGVMLRKVGIQTQTDTKSKQPIQ